jgi:hypothetical protein
MESRLTWPPIQKPSALAEGAVAPNLLSYKAVQASFPGRKHATN